MSDQPVFNSQQLLDSTCDDKELASQVVGVFLSDIPVQLNDLDKALETNDAKTAERVAHSIKGASATVGGERLRAVAFVCEQYGRDGDLDQLRGLVEVLRAEYDLLGAVLRQEGFVEE